MMSFRIQKVPKGFAFSDATWKNTWTVVTLTDLGDSRTDVRISGMGYADTEDGQNMRHFFATGNAWVMQNLQSQFDASVPAPRVAPSGDDPLAPVIHERVIDLPRSDVWRLLSTSAGWKQLFDVESTIELRPGGKFEVLFKPATPLDQQGSGGCTVLSLIPEQMLSFTWNAPPKFEYVRERRTWVVAHFDELSAGRTRLRITHLGFAEAAANSVDQAGEWEQVRDFFDGTWESVLDAVEQQESKR